ncbi:unnamed protein product [Oppiella nova]|uniref:Peptidase S54 rhomboid domain-containing protein n=1 Tax=Oppiella nova TaxID=334625 RepID=A0A7R9M8R4_9ACAR|nr:unnamed protein product [Oppiella nova]CAG2172703.1 unnamed protein product [Oppiella nova]
MNRNRGQSRVPSFAVLLLVHELVRTATTYGIPTVTLVTTVTQILIFLRIIPLPVSDVWDVCLSYRSIIDKKEYLRLILSQLSHGDDWHLYYNMVSFLWKGRSLENRLGSLRFAITLLVFTISTAYTYVFANKLMADVSEDYSYLSHCSVGFSGVIFALKVLTTHFDDSRVSYLMGWIPIGSKYAVWGELVVIQLISPNASFVGHLAGILVGLAYIYGPLSYAIEFVFSLYILNPLFGGLGGNSNNNYGNYRRNYNSSSTSGYSSNRHNYESYVPNDMSEEEQLRRAYEQSLNDNRNSRPRTQPTAPPYPTENSDNYPQNPSDAETLRQLRLRRYQQN